MQAIKQYLASIEKALKVDNATEHTHRPALKSLIEALIPGITATNEPKHIACGAPDYVVTRKNFIVGYIEAKDVGKSLDEVERSDQLKRYLRSLENLILTDYLEFRWYVGGEHRQTVRLSKLSLDGKFKTDNAAIEELAGLLTAFLEHKAQPINTPRDLATRMARLTHMVRDIIFEAFEQGQASTLLQNWRQAFAKVLISDLDQPEKTADFADMLAQTLAYGLFTARVMDTTPEGFTRQEAQHLIPKTNPFLRDFFYQITGPQMDDEPFACFVDDLVYLLAQTDMEAVLADFGRRTKQEDPVVHFYETFLAAYDPKLRESRGVYYTPEPVVSYIVRSVDYLLKTRFNCPDGLADSTKITVPNRDPGKTIKGKKELRKTDESHKVLILDPACGTGTFLYSVIDHIRQGFMQQGNAGMWPGYVKNHLLPRIFGFELLMAPYAVAHFKLSLQLAGRDLTDAQRAQWAYTPADGERLGIYLTNALEEPHEMTGLPLFTQFVADETNAANEVKQHLPIMVVMGNPPYSNFGMMNKGNWIREQLKEYKKGLNEKKINLDDDFIKFMRFGQWRIDQSGVGILAFISNNTYLDGITHRRMRQSLMETFTDIFILDLHGSTKKKEKCPDGSKDENIFDIQQGVAIGIFIKQPNKKRLCKLNFAELYGRRLLKYKMLSEITAETIKWTAINPTPEYFFFKRSNQIDNDEYKLMPSITDVLVDYVSGIQTGRDDFVSKLSFDDFETWVKLLANKNIQESDIRSKTEFPKWNGFDFTTLRKRLNDATMYQTMIKKWLYRPFDLRPIIFDDSCIKRTRGKIMAQLTMPNIALVTVRQLSGEHFYHTLLTNNIGDGNTISLNTREYNYYFPLYVYTSSNQLKLSDKLHSPLLKDSRVNNLNPAFVNDLRKNLSLSFVSDGTGDLDITFGPEDVLHYIYAVFHSPTYRNRYAEFLKSDFPRVPLTSDKILFKKLCELGKELVGLHLLESPADNQFITRYPVTGDNLVEKGYPKYNLPVSLLGKEGQKGGQCERVYINKTQYFEGVPQDVWEFYIGGYQVCDKWLKDRRGRQLSYDDLSHYQKVIVALKETIRLMEAIDQAIPEWPLK